MWTSISKILGMQTEWWWCFSCLVMKRFLILSDV